MPNFTILNAAGASDVDGLPAIGLYVPGSGYGSLLGGAVSSADLNSNQAATPHLATAATPVIQSASSAGAGQAITCTMACPAGKTLYLVGFSFTCSPPSATVANQYIQITGLQGGTYFVQTQQKTADVVNIIQAFGMPLIASGASVNIVGSYGALTNGGFPALLMWGFAL